MTGSERPSGPKNGPSAGHDPVSDRDRWNARYRELSAPADAPQALRNMAHLLPSVGIGVDLAGGDGAGAQMLAGHGLHPVLVEVSDVALELARSRAMPDGLPLRVIEADLARTALAEVLADAAQPGSDDGDERVAVVTCFHYLMRPLLAAVPLAVPPGARFLCAIATTTNLERHQRPSRRFLVEPGELPRLVLGPAGTDREGVTVLHHWEGWNQHGLHEAELAVEITP